MTGADAAAPLDGLVVLDLSTVGPGQFCTVLLADMGADVIEITKPGWAPLGGEQHDASPYLRRNKRSIALDLKSAEGARTLTALAAKADILVEGMRPGAMQRLGLDYASLSAQAPRLIYCSMSGFGQSGPYAALPGHDLNYVALAGLFDLFDFRDRGPLVPPNLIADYGAALHSVIGILLALTARESSGEGQHVDISYLDTTFALLSAATSFRQYAESGACVPADRGIFSGRYPYYTLYETADGRYVSVACLEQSFWSNLCSALGAEDVLAAGFRPEDLDQRPKPAQSAARERLAQVFRSRPLADWRESLRDLDACVAPVNTIAEAFTDPQIAHREMARPIERAGEARFAIGSPIRLSKTPARMRSGPPGRGEDTDEILARFGISAELSGSSTVGRGRA